MNIGRTLAQWLLAALICFGALWAIGQLGQLLIPQAAHGSVLACVRKPETCEQVTACVKAVGVERAERLARRAGATEAQIEQGRACVNQMATITPK